MTTVLPDADFAELDSKRERVRDDEPREALFDNGAEQVVLGAMMTDPSIVADMASMLAPADFYRPQHATIFAAIVTLDGGQHPTDPVAVATYLGEIRQLSRIGGAGYLHTLMASVPTIAGNAAYYAKIIAGKAILRSLLTTVRRIEQLAQAAAHDQAASVLDTARQWLADLDAPITDSGPVAWGDILPTTLAAIEADGAGEIPTNVIPTGFQDLDQLLSGGMRPGQLVIVAGRPGSGKSTAAAGDFVRAAAFNRHARRKPVAVFSLEMSQDEIARRLLSAEARVPLHVLTEGKLSEEDWRRLHHVAADTESAPLFVDTTPNLTVADIRARCRRVKRQHGLSLVVVDYLQLLAANKGTGRESRQEQLEAMSRALKLLGKELDVPVVAVCQLNRGPEMRADKVPTAADLRGSGALEQDADVIVLLFRPDAYDKESPRAGELDFIVDKNRNGPKDTVTVAAQLHLSRFVDMAVMEPR